MAQHLCNLVVLVTPVSVVQVVGVYRYRVEHNDTNLVGQSHDDAAKVTEMTLINALHLL